MAFAHHNIRPIRPADRDALDLMTRGLSPESRRRRFLGPKHGLSSRELTYLTEVDHRRHVALVVENPAGRMLAVARYAMWPGSEDRADTAFEVIDELQGKGIGTRLGRQLVWHARRNGIAILTGSTLAENAPAHALMVRLGFIRGQTSAGVTDYELHLRAHRLDAAA